MASYFELRNVTKVFPGSTALRDVWLSAAEPSIVGLIGKNGSGKTTLLRHVVGMNLPTVGTCTTFGVPTVDLGGDQFARIGMCHQHDPLIGWMTGARLVRYVSGFHARWDEDLERTLVDLFEIDVRQRVAAMSPGTRQKLSIVLASCHAPDLLLLDEPMSDVDPVSRRDILETLLDRFRDRPSLIVISSHLLHDVEAVSDRIVCLDRGRVIADASLDDLKESYVEWLVTSPAGALPPAFPESFVLSQDVSSGEARLTVRDGAAHAEAFERRYRAHVESKSLSLDRIFRLLVGAHDDRRGSSPAVGIVSRR